MARVRGDGPTLPARPVATAPVPATVAALAVLAAGAVPTILWWAVGQPILQLAAIVLLLVAHERLGRAWASRHPEDVVPADAPALRADLLISLGLAAAVVAFLLLLETGLGLEVWSTIGPFTPVAPTLDAIREVTARLRRRRVGVDAPESGRR